MVQWLFLRAFLSNPLCLHSFLPARFHFKEQNHTALTCLRIISPRCDAYAQIFQSNGKDLSEIEQLLFFLSFLLPMLDLYSFLLLLLLLLLFSMLCAFGECHMNHSEVKLLSMISISEFHVKTHFFKLSTCTVTLDLSNWSDLLRF